LSIECYATTTFLVLENYVIKTKKIDALQFICMIIYMIDFTAQSRALVRLEIKRALVHLRSKHVLVRLGSKLRQKSSHD